MGSVPRSSQRAAVTATTPRLSNTGGSGPGGRGSHARARGATKTPQPKRQRRDLLEGPEEAAVERPATLRKQPRVSSASRKGAAVEKPGDQPAEKQRRRSPSKAEAAADVVGAAEGPAGSRPALRDLRAIV